MTSLDHIRPWRVLHHDLATGRTHVQTFNSYELALHSYRSKRNVVGFTAELRDPSNRCLIHSTNDCTARLEPDRDGLEEAAAGLYTYDLDTDMYAPVPRFA